MLNFVEEQGTELHCFLLKNLLTCIDQDVLGVRSQHDVLLQETKKKHSKKHSTRPY